MWCSSAPFSSNLSECIIDMTIKLQSELNIRQVADLKEELSAALNTDDSLILDASQVSATDAAGLQLLTAFIQQALLKKRSVEWHKPSECFLSAVKQMGLSESLNI